MALVHSGKTQNASDPFVVHNHTTENNNTVWVRLESAPREGLPHSDKAGNERRENGSSVCGEGPYLLRTKEHDRRTIAHLSSSGLFTGLKRAPTGLS